MMITVSLAGCVSQDDYDAAIEEHEEEKAEDAANILCSNTTLVRANKYANALKAQMMNP